MEGTEQNIPRKQQLPALTGARLFLALWVILYHQIPHEDTTVTVSWLGSLPLPFHLFLRTGYAAVTVFFVLSGFVLAYNQTEATVFYDCVIVSLSGIACIGAGIITLMVGPKP